MAVLKPKEVMRHVRMARAASLGRKLELRGTPEAWVGFDTDPRPTVGAPTTRTDRSEHDGQALEARVARLVELVHDWRPCWCGAGQLELVTPTHVGTPQPARVDVTSSSGPEGDALS